jgi:hypothetical protein
MLSCHRFVRGLCRLPTLRGAAQVSRVDLPEVVE